MRILTALILVGSTFLFKPAVASDVDGFLGTWRFYQYIYEGQVVPAPNPNLRLLMSFCEDGTQVLFWDRIGEVGFCERMAHFRIERDIMSLKTYWVNPKNHISCAQDPDMVADKESLNRVGLVDGELYLYLEIDGKDLIYIFKRENGGNYLCQKPYQ